MCDKLDLKNIMWFKLELYNTTFYLLNDGQITTEEISRVNSYTLYWYIVREI